MDLFGRAKINVFDGDDRENNVDINYRANLRRLLDNGMELRGIQIFHYAAPHYASRYNRPVLRYINALVNGGACIGIKDGYMVLTNTESNELQRQSSEIIAVGLANMMVCKWFDINTKYINPIRKTTKRCDFEFQLNNTTYIYEVKGRKNRSQFNEALHDAILKKANHQADEKLAFICHLPRDRSPLSINVYDPEVDAGESYDKTYRLVNHYARMCRLSGLTILAEVLEKRVQTFESRKEWTSEPVGYSENVTKMINEVTIGNHKYLTSRHTYELSYSETNSSKMVLYFGISDKVVRMLEQWNIEELNSYNHENYVDEDKKISFLEDGTFMCITKARF